MLSDSNIDGISSIIKSYLAQFPSQSLPLLPKKKQTKNPPEKNSLYFQKWIFLALILKKFLYSLKRKLFLYFLIFLKTVPCTFQPKFANKKNPPHENFLYFRKRKLQKQLLYFRKRKP